jgi:hypothetical protein
VNYACRSRLGNYSVAGLLLCAILTSLPGFAETVLDTIPSLESVSSRLELTPEQEAKLRPIFEKRMSELVQAQLLYQRASTPQQKRNVLSEAKLAGDAFNAQVESVLSPSQQHEWREFRSEQREKVKERAEDKQSSQ